MSHHHHHHHLLQTGSRGDAVTALQSALSALGYNLDVDGIFGPGTHRAVVAFQRSYGLGADGIVGPKTWQAIAASMG